MLRSRPSLLPTATALLFTLLAATAVGPAAQATEFPAAPDADVLAGQTRMVSRAVDGSAGAGTSETPAVSADGNFVAFASDAEDLVDEPTASGMDVFLYNRSTDKTIVVSRGFDGSPANGPSWSPAITEDGRYITFTTIATNLIDEDVHWAQQIYVYDRTTGAMTLESRTPDGKGANENSYDPAISSNGRYVAFASTATNILPGERRNPDIFVRDRTTGVTTLVSHTPDGGATKGWSRWPAFSNDGRFLTFTSSARDLAAPDTRKDDDIFLWDRTTDAITLVSRNDAGKAANRNSYDSSISGDGRMITYYSYADNLPGGFHVGREVYLFDRVTQKTVRVSHRPDGEHASDESWAPTIDDSGRYVSFESWADDLVPDDGYSGRDAFVYDVETGRMRMISRSTTGGPANGNSSTVVISPGASYVTYQSEASNLVAGDGNALPDVFLVRFP